MHYVDPATAVAAAIRASASSSAAALRRAIGIEVLVYPKCSGIRLVLACSVGRSMRDGEAKNGKR